VRTGDFVLGGFFPPCPCNWGGDPKSGYKIVAKAVKSCLFPLYEIERGITKLNYNPEKAGQKIPVRELFQTLGSVFAHLASEKFAEVTEEIQKEVDRRWQRLLAMDANPAL
jgi:pyruvate ferredoxin oxidoreductase alpha subunit